MEEYFQHFGFLVSEWLKTHGLKIILIAAGAMILKYIIKQIIIKAVRVAVVAEGSTTTSMEAEKKREDTLIRILTGASGMVILILTVLVILPEFDIKIGPLLAGAGVAGIALGFGSQYLIRDIISGLFIIIENQYRIGDVVNIDETGGLVEDISIRKTTLRDMDGTVHHIPHGEIKKVSNMSKKFARVNLNISIAYDADIDHVIKVIDKTGIELSEDPLYMEFITVPPKFLRIDEFSDSAIVIKILGETKPLKQWDVAGELRKRLKEAFDNEGIEIPFPQMVIHHLTEKNDTR